jgi:hypothetical protein
MKWLDNRNMLGQLVLDTGSASARRPGLDRRSIGVPPSRGGVRRVCSILQGSRASVLSWCFTVLVLEGQPTRRWEAGALPGHDPRACRADHGLPRGAGD